MIARFLSRATESPASRSAWWCMRKMFNFIRKLIKSFWYDEKWISFFLWKKYFFRNCGVVSGVAPKISMIWSIVIFESPPFPDFWLLGSARVYFILPGLTVLMVLSESVTMQSSSMGVTNWIWISQIPRYFIRKTLKSYFCDGIMEFLKCLSRT